MVVTRKQDPRHKVSLELVQIDVQASIESKGGGDTRNDLSDDSVQVGEARGGDVQVLLANVVNGLVINLNISYD